MTVYSYCTSPHVWTGLNKLSYSGQNALLDMAPHRRAEKRNNSFSDLSKLEDHILGILKPLCKSVVTYDVCIFARQ